MNNPRHYYQNGHRRTYEHVEDYRGRSIGCFAYYSLGERTWCATINHISSVYDETQDKVIAGAKACIDRWELYKELIREARENLNDEWSSEDTEAELVAGQKFGDWIQRHFDRQPTSLEKTYWGVQIVAQAARELNQEQP